MLCWRYSTIRIDASSLRRSLHNFGDNLWMHFVMVFSVDSCTQMAAMLGGKLLKTVKARREDDYQFSNKEACDGGGYRDWDCSIAHPNSLGGVFYAALEAQDEGGYGHA